MEDPVLRFAVLCHQTCPSDYTGYHLLHYLLVHASRQTPGTPVIPNILEYPNPYDFALAILDWRDLEGIAPIPCLYTEHNMSEHFLRSPSIPTQQLTLSYKMSLTLRSLGKNFQHLSA